MAIAQQAQWEQPSQTQTTSSSSPSFLIIDPLPTVNIGYAPFINLRIKSVDKTSTIDKTICFNAEIIKGEEAKTRMERRIGSAVACCRGCFDLEQVSKV